MIRLYFSRWLKVLVFGTLCFLILAYIHSSANLSKDLIKRTIYRELNRFQQQGGNTLGRGGATTTQKKLGFKSTTQKTSPELSLPTSSRLSTKQRSTFRYSTLDGKKQTTSSSSGLSTTSRSTSLATSTDSRKRGTTLPITSERSKTSTLAIVKKLGELAVKPAKALFTKTTALWTTFQNRQTQSKIMQMKGRYIGKKEKKMLLETLGVFLSTLRKENITHILYGGSLLGSWRHHGLITWDDDIDMFLDNKDRSRVVKALAKQKGYTPTNAGRRVKFHSDTAPVTTRYGWKWPYIDIQFYAGNATHIWDVGSEFSHVKYSRNITFPLHTRRFEGFHIPSPAHSLRFLWVYYGKTKYCNTGWYQHNLEAGSKVISVPCSQLADVHPFVHRRVKGGLMEETLMFRNRTLHRELVKEPLDSVTEPYGLDLMKPL